MVLGFCLFFPLPVSFSFKEYEKKTIIYLTEIIYLSCFLLLVHVCHGMCLFVCLMVFNATFNNISVISCRSVLLVEDNGGPREDHRPVASH